MERFRQLSSFDPNQMLQRFRSRQGGGSSSGSGVKRGTPIHGAGGGQPQRPIGGISGQGQVQRFGTQERGSQGGDAVANTRRRAPGQAPVTDPNQLDRFITPENTLNRQRLGFDVREVSPNTSGIQDAISRLQSASSGGGGGFDPSSGFLEFLRGQVRGDLEGGLNREELIRRQFEAQQPFLNQQFRDQADQIANQTAALGRTGSGQVDRQFAELENQQQLKREGLLGQITSRAAQQAIQDRLGLMGQGQGIAGVQTQRDIGAANAANQARRTNIQGMSNAMQGALGASRLGLQGQQMNQQRDLAQSRFLERQRAFENQLARQAMQDKQSRLGMLQQGFASDPTGQLQRQAATNMLGAGEFGATSSAGASGLQELMRQHQRSQAQGGGGGGILSSFMDLFGGPSSQPTITPNPNVPDPRGGIMNDRFINRTPTDLGGLL